jgi:anti-sigma factor RsiW
MTPREDMTCEDVRQGDVAERYVSGRLGEDEQSAFERHYFTCDACAGTVKTLTAVRQALGQRSAARSWRFAAAAAGLAACAAVAVFLMQPKPPAPAPVVTRPVTPSPEPAAVLARVEPPPYVALAVRGDADRFEAAMQHYTRGDYDAAARALRALGPREPRANIQFYLGASELMAGRAAESVPPLEAAVRLGAREQSEHAQFLLGKAWIAQGRIDAARTALTACAALRGAHADEAARLLARLPQQHVPRP